MKEYCEQLCAHGFNNIGKIVLHLERHELPNLTQGEINYLNRYISIKEIESIINHLSKKNAADLDGSTGEFYQTFNKVIFSLHSLFQKIVAEEKALFNSFNKASIIP